MRKTGALGLLGGIVVLSLIYPLRAQMRPASSPPSAPPLAETLVLPLPDTALQAGLRAILAQAPYRRLVQEKRLSVALVDLSDPRFIRYAGIDDDRERYAASLPKIGILLGVFYQIDRGAIRYTPELRRKMELMIRRSDNAISSEMIRLVGFQNIADALRDPKHQLYDPQGRGGGIWVGKGYGSGVGVWKRDPVGNTSHGATARQVARFLVMMDQGMLVSPWASSEMKSIMGNPQIKHKFVAGLANRPGSQIYRKSGTWETWHADCALVERDGKKYVAVALAESASGSSILSSLILRLDDLVVTGSPNARRAVGEADPGGR
jgi:beta-lactamase class A